MSDEKPQDASEGSIGQSASTAGLGVAIPPGYSFSFHVYVSNDELAAAISYAFDRCSQTYVGGYTTKETEAGKAMLEHLKELLAIQRARAGFMESPNA